MHYNELMQETTFEKELSFVGDKQVFIIGVDEAGRGPLAGPVVAAAACCKDQKFYIPEKLKKDFVLIRDSKKLSAKQREKTFAFIEERFYYSIGIVGVKTIDRVNVLQASFFAMKSALTDLRRKLLSIGSLSSGKLEIYDGMYLLVDGNQTIPNISVKQEAIVNGDSTVKSIAAASIVAKVVRDRIMNDFDKKYPNYGFIKHKGYGTREHMDALRRFGHCPIHRMSFRPVLLSIPENANKRFSKVLKPNKR